ncbi:hypothetical protein Tco_0967578 [Tanacetum coccineum]
MDSQCYPKVKSLEIQYNLFRLEAFSRKSLGSMTIVSYIQDTKEAIIKINNIVFLLAFYLNFEPDTVIRSLKDGGWADMVLNGYTGTKRDEEGSSVRNKASQELKYQVVFGLCLIFGFHSLSTWTVKSAFLDGILMKRFMSHNLLVLLILLNLQGFMRWSKPCMDCTKPLELGKLLSSNILREAWIQRRGHLTRLLFIRRNKKDILLVQVISNEFMGELTFFFRSTSQAEQRNASSISTTSNSKDFSSQCCQEIFQVTSRGQEPNWDYGILRESPLIWKHSTDSDYGWFNLDKESKLVVGQFLGQRLISCNGKKQTIVATSTTEAEYVAVANCYGQVLWVQNQLLDYGFNFMNTKIHIDNESTIWHCEDPSSSFQDQNIEIRHPLSSEIVMRRSS